MEVGERLTQITLGLDEVYRRQVGGEGVLNQEGLVPVNLTQAVPAAFRDWDEAEGALFDLESVVSGRPAGLRRTFLLEMIDSLRGLVATYRGDPLTYRERVERCLRVSADRVPDDFIEGLAQRAGELLRQLGYGQAELGQGIERWEASRQVPPDQVTAVLKKLLYEARERTEHYMFPVGDEMLEPVGISGAPFSAYCDYPGRQLRLNLDYAYTRPALKHLACHEGFPGHLVHLAVREALTRRGEMPLDGALVVTTSASSPLFEGIGEQGIYFLDWITGPDDELQMTLTRLRSAARVNAAVMLHAESRTVEEAAGYLRRVAFLGVEVARSRIAFLTHRLRAPFIFAYWRGDLGVERVWQTVTPADRARFFHFLYDHMHTPATLYDYWSPSA